MYIIDGYNFLFQIHSFDGTLEQGRETLLSFLESASNQKKLQITIIFDGADLSPYPHHKSYGTLNIVYSPAYMTADDYILEELSSMDKPHIVTLVTSDKQLAKKARALKAKSVTIDHFLNEVIQKKIKVVRSKQEPKFDFQESTQNILRLEKIFLDKLNKKK